VLRAVSRIRRRHQALRTIYDIERQEQSLRNLSDLDDGEVAIYDSCAKEYRPLLLSALGMRYPGTERDVLRDVSLLLPAGSVVVRASWPGFHRARGWMIAPESARA
jgi:hypothetical protein